MLPISPYRKMQAARVFDTVLPSKQTDKVVKGRAEIVDYLTHYDGEYVGDLSRNNALEALLGGVLTVDLSANGIRWSVVPVKEGLIPSHKITDVAIGPFNL